MGSSLSGPAESEQAETPRPIVSAGLARIYGMRTSLPDGRDSRTYLARLAELEAQAKAARRGAWGKSQP
jgi:endonuclease YncB( thermonuclease family)